MHSMRPILGYLLQQVQICTWFTIDQGFQNKIIKKGNQELRLGIAQDLHLSQEALRKEGFEQECWKTYQPESYW